MAQSTTILLHTEGLVSLSTVALTHFYLMLTQADAEKALGFVIVENFFQPSHVYLKQSAEVLSFAELICPPQ